MFNCSKNSSLELLKVSLGKATSPENKGYKLYLSFFLEPGTSRTKTLKKINYTIYLTNIVYGFKKAIKININKL